MRCIEVLHTLCKVLNNAVFWTQADQGAETSCVCVCTKRVCVCDKKPNRCTVVVYSTEESRYLYSLGEYICLLLIVYLKISLICV